MRSTPARRVVSILGASALAASMLSGCGGDPAGAAPELTWYINPDAGGQAEIAKRCTEASEGRYTIATPLLPRESADQRLQLVRRLAANDSSIDIMSLDPPYIPEFSQAGFLAPVPAEVAERVSEGVVDSALEGASWDGELVTVPFWANTQLLWYRKSVAEAAGLDMSQPVTWQQLIDTAKENDTQLAVQGIRAEALTVWVNALVESAGGEVITQASPEDPEQVQLGLDSEAGAKAATVLREIGRSGVGGPALSTSGESENATAFQGERAGFMVNWPFVWPQALDGVEGGTLEPSVPEDYGWAQYPRVDADAPSAPPYGGINLGVGAFSENADLAYEATECITSAENQTYYFVTNGNPASKEAVFDDPAVTEAFPMASVIRDSLQDAAPRPQTAYYSEVSESIQRDYHPPGSVQPGRTGAEATELIKAVLAKEELL